MAPGRSPPAAGAGAPPACGALCRDPQLWQQTLPPCQQGGPLHGVFGEAPSSFSTAGGCGGPGGDGRRQRAWNSGSGFPAAGGLAAATARRRQERAVRGPVVAVVGAWGAGPARTGWGALGTDPRGCCACQPGSGSPERAGRWCLGTLARGQVAVCWSSLSRHPLALAHLSIPPSLGALPGLTPPPGGVFSTWASAGAASHPDLGLQCRW